MMSDKEDYINVLGAFCLADRIEIISPEEFENVKKAIKNILTEREHDKSKIKKLEEENRTLKVVRSEYAYGYENTYFITKNDLVQIDKNKYFIEIEEGKFVDLKQVYLDNKNGIPKQKIKDKIERLNRKEQELQNSISEEEREEYSDANISYLLCDMEIRKQVLKELMEDK